jgi:hypothetical protein
MTNDFCTFVVDSSNTILMPAFEKFTDFLHLMTISACTQAKPVESFNGIIFRYLRSTETKFMR